MLAELNLPTINQQTSQSLIGKGASNFVERALLAVGARPDFQEQALARFLVHYESITATLAPAYPGVFEGLNQLVQWKIPLACVTNKQTSLALKLLRTHNIEHQFNIVIGGDMMLHKKPDPWSILQVCKQLNIDVSEGLFIGDSDNDIDAAKAANMRSVALPYGYSGARPFDELGADSVVSGLSELINSIAKERN